MAPCLLSCVEEILLLALFLIQDERYGRKPDILQLLFLLSRWDRVSSARLKTFNIQVKMDLYLIGLGIFNFVLFILWCLALFFEISWLLKNTARGRHLNCESVQFKI